jgi:hypothetical protein
MVEMEDITKTRDGRSAAVDGTFEGTTRGRAVSEPGKQPGPEQPGLYELAAYEDFVMDQNGNSTRSSFSHWEPEPGFAHVDGDIGGPGYNETKADIIAVPCIGASPVETWTRDPLPDGYFEIPDDTREELGKYPTVKGLPGGSILSPAINRHLPKAKHLWVRHGIRMEVSTARVMLYRHRELAEGLTLDQMADDLLEHIRRMREGQTKARPLFFICHSIGGLVAKLALVKASQIEELRCVIFDCHGMTFFGKPLL